MQDSAYASIGWTELFDRLAALRAELARMNEQGVVDFERYRQVRTEISACRQEIERFHKRMSSDRDTPGDDGLRRI